jgi:uncharacterized protein involved in tolerance to divalent cations
MLFLIISFDVNASEKRDAYSLIDGYDFDIKCAHGNYAKSQINAGLCYTVIQQSVYAFYMATGALLNEKESQCYYKNFEFSKQSILAGIKLVEDYYNKHPENLSMGIAYAFHLVHLERYPIPNKCLSLN